MEGHNVSHQLVSMLNESGEPDMLRSKSTHESGHPLNELPALKWFFAVSLIGQAIFGTIGGLLVIGSALVVGALQHTGNAFVINLAIADICITAVATPANALGALYGHNFFSSNPVYCSFVSVLCATGCLASCWNMCMIAINRYMYICQWDVYGKVYTPRNTQLLCLAVWLIAYLIHLPNYVGWGDLRFSEQFFLCTFANHEHSYAVFYVVVGVFFPLTVSFLSYLMVYLKVKDSKTICRRILNECRADSGLGCMNSVSTSSDNTLAAGKDEVLVEQTAGGCTGVSQNFYDDLKIIKVMFRVQVIYTAMWLPLMVLILLHMASDISSVWYILVILSAHGNSAINCLVYAAYIDHFRDGYRKLLTLCTHGRSRNRAVPHRREASNRRQRTSAHVINTTSSE